MSKNDSKLSFAPCSHCALGTPPCCGVFAYSLEHSLFVTLNFPAFCVLGSRGCRAGPGTGSLCCLEKLCNNQPLVIREKYYTDEKL